MAISADQLSATIDQELTQYRKEVTEKIKNEAKKSIDQLVKETKATAPVGKSRKHYRDSISSKILEDSDQHITYMWYVKGSDSALSHLLEHGHATRNGGRTKAFHFIKNASDPILEQYVHTVEEILRNG